MEELLTRYGIADILIFCAVLAAAVKGLITFWDWLWGRIKQVTDRDYAEENERKVLEKKVGSLEAFYAEREKVDRRFAEVDATFEEINQRIDTLIRSDREQMKQRLESIQHTDCVERDRTFIKQQKHSVLLSMCILKRNALTAWMRKWKCS